VFSLRTPLAARFGLCFALGSALASWSTPRARGQEPPAGFVQARGNQLLLDGQPFRFLGANVSVMHGPRERAGYEAVLDAVVLDGLKVVRLWALGEQPAPGEPHHPLYAFRIGESGWVEESFVHLDRVLLAARERGLKVIVVLANRWSDYGGIATYLRWGGLSLQRDAAGEPASSALAAFLECTSCQALYAQHVERVVGRTNSITKLAYRDDPTIMAWELINEASAVGAREEELLLAWIKHNARLVRALDARHLISAGHIGYQTSRERNVWRAVQDIPEIDFADAHFYPAHDPRVSRRAELPALLDDPIALALLDVQKPLVLGEFGFAREAYKAASERRHWFQTFVGHALSRGVSGALVWIYEPGDNPIRSHTIRSHPADDESLATRRLLNGAALRLAAATAPAVPEAWLAPEGRPVFTGAQHERGERKPHRDFVTRGSSTLLEIAPSGYAQLSFERAGIDVREGREVLWGAGAGYVEFRFVAPAFVPRALAIEARVSSELPGEPSGRDFRDGSDIELSLDGVTLGTVRARPDDGRGEVVRVELVDPFLLARLFSARAHRLRLRALPSSYAGGLCIYGSAPRAAEPATEAALNHVRVVLERP
jgi:Cellulase (glycosyl hydrolase family 5)